MVASKPLVVGKRMERVGGEIIVEILGRHYLGRYLWVSDTKTKQGRREQQISLYPSPKTIDSN